MNIILWIVQILLALAFLMSGFMKATQPYEKLKESMAYVGDFSPNTIRAIGILEVLGAIGLVLPSVTLILPWLTPVAAGGLVLTMVGAAITHIRRGNEMVMIVTNLVLLALATFVIYGRFISVPL